MATVTKPMALDETLKATNVALGLIKDAINATAVYPTADNVSYDNTVSGLDATNVESAINELNSEKADIADIPTKTSDLTNDSNFVSDSNYVHTDNNYTTTDKNIVNNVTSNLANKVDKVSGKGLSTNDFTTAYMNKLSGIESGAEVNVQSNWSQTTTTADDYIKNKPTKLSEFTNDSNFITNTVSNLTNYYTKSNTYTKTEVDSLIATIVTLNILVVQTLPTSDISTTTIYLVPKTTSETNNVYDEYINTDGTTQGWEKIGDTSVDLSNYYTISQVDTLLSNKVDKVSGKGLSTNDFTTTLKNKLDGIASGAEVNVQANWTQTTTTADDYIKNKPTLATVATSGSYNDLSDLPSTPTANDISFTPTTYLSSTNVQKAIEELDAESFRSRELCTETDANTIIKPGIYWCDPSVTANLPDTAWGILEVVNTSKSNSTYPLTQKYTVVNYLGNKYYFRTYRYVSPSYVWSDWQTYESANNLFAYNGVAGAKNLLTFPYYSKTTTASGITYTVNNDATITVNGTATATSVFTVTNYRNYDGSETAWNKIVETSSGKFKLTGCPSGGSTGTYYLQCSGGADGHTSWYGGGIDSGNGFTFSANIDSNKFYIYVCRIVIVEGCVCNNLVFKPMLRDANDVDETFRPYAMTNKELTTPTFTQASTRANINSGETISTILGKIKKFFADLKTVAFTGNASDLTYDNSTSGLSATDVQSAINEIDTEITDVYKYNGIMGAKNLIPYPFYNKGNLTASGITYTDNGDGTLTIDGTATADSEYVFVANANNYKPIAGTYRLTGIDDGSANTYFIQWTYDNVNDYLFQGEKSYTVDGTKYIRLSVRVKSGATVNNVIVSPMLRLVDDTDTTFRPYAMTNKELTDNLNTTHGNYYGTCATSSSTSAKVITVNEDFKLAVGTTVTVKFSYTNTASNPTINVNGTGAKSVWYSASVVTTASLSTVGTANRYIKYMYDGTYWVWQGWSVDNFIGNPQGLGFGYGTCATAESTTAKVVTLANYSLMNGGYVSVKFTYAVSANATMNINSKGAKAIYYRGSAITGGVIKAGDIATFIYNGTNYILLGVDSNSDNSNVIDLIYPIGSIYASTVNTNPSTYFGGTWVSVSETLLVVNNGTANTTQYKWRRTA